jgi:hypothetical protein
VTNEPFSLDSRIAGARDGLGGLRHDLGSIALDERFRGQVTRRRGIASARTESSGIADFQYSLHEPLAGAVDFGSGE